MKGKSGAAHNILNSETFSVVECLNATKIPSAADDSPSSLRDEQIIRYYETAGPDYLAWSKHYNMHFGYWRWGLNPFSRERMLEETTHQVLNRIIRDENFSEMIIDIGCGLGASMRTGAKRYSNKKFMGVTFVPDQVRKGQEITTQAGLNTQVTFLQADYHQLPLPTNSSDACYAIESVVYSEGFDKRRLLQEVYRVLKPRGRFAIIDCFLKQESSQMTPLVRRCYRQACFGWAVKEMPHLGKFLQAMNEVGFVGTNFQDISWRAAPSVAHVPLVIARFLISKLLTFQGLKPESKRHVISCLLSCVLGLARPSFSYVVVCGEKR